MGGWRYSGGGLRAEERRGFYHQETPFGHKIIWISVQEMVQIIIIITKTKYRQILNP